MNLNGGRPQILPKQKPVMREWLDEIKPKVIVELGCWLGESTVLWGEWARDNGAIVFAIDHWKDNHDTGLMGKRDSIFGQFKNNLDELDLWETVHPIMGDSAETAKYFKDGFADFVFIDACHLYSRVSKDIDAWLPKVRKDGLICGHDFEGEMFLEEGIERDFFKERHNGVIKAVMERFPGSESVAGMWRHIV